MGMITITGFSAFSSGDTGATDGRPTNGHFELPWLPLVLPRIQNNGKWQDMLIP